MKKLFCLLAVVASATFTSLSAAESQVESEKRSRPSREAMAERANEKLAERLALSESQSKRLLEINSSYAEECKSARATMKSELESAEQKKMSAIVSLLDDDQLAKLLIVKSRSAQRDNKRVAQSRKGGRDQQMKRGKHMNRRQHMNRRAQTQRSQAPKREIPQKRSDKKSSAISSKRATE